MQCSTHLRYSPPKIKGSGGKRQTMSTGEHPITRAELREELDRTLKHYATKAEVAFMILAGTASTAAVVTAVIQLVG